jgi:hypothetical protein
VITVRIVPMYPGSTQVQVFRGRNKEPHLVINGACADQLDHKKIAAYVEGCDWTDKGSEAYVTPQLWCDDFMIL